MWDVHGLIDHSGSTCETVHCKKCGNPIMENEFYHRIGNDLFCKKCDPAKKKMTRNP